MTTNLQERAGAESVGCNSAPGAPYDYVLCGWSTRSDIKLTRVSVARATKGTEIVIQLGTERSPTSNAGGGTYFDHSAECSFIGIRNVADFEVKGGQSIRIWPADGAAQKDIEIFLLGPVWGALCHQRGVLPLHASAVLTKAGIAAFAGHSGAGKSTTGALMGSLGYELVADDLLPVSLNQDLVPGAWPYLRRLKLHRESFGQLALTPTEAVGQTLDKEKCFAHPRLSGRDEWSKLERVYLLEIDQTCSSVSIERITGAEAIRAFVDQTYHFQFIVGSSRLSDHLKFCARLASEIPLFRLRRPPSLGIRKDVGSLIRGHLEGESI
jgi:hypothetical protein